MVLLLECPTQLTCGFQVPHEYCIALSGTQVLCSAGRPTDTGGKWNRKPACPFQAQEWQEEHRDNWPPPPPPTPWKERFELRLHPFPLHTRGHTHTHTLMFMFHARPESGTSCDVAVNNVERQCFCSHAGGHLLTKWPRYTCTPASGPASLSGTQPLEVLLLQWSAGAGS